MRHLSECYLRYSFDVCSLVKNIYEFLACLSVYLLAYILMEIMFIFCFPKFWMKFLKTFLGCFKLNPNKYISLVRLCVSLTFLQLAELTYWLLNFCVLVSTLIPLVLSQLCSLRVSLWDLWSCSFCSPESFHWFHAIYVLYFGKSWSISCKFL